MSVVYKIKKRSVMIQLFCVVGFILYLCHNNAAVPRRRSHRDVNLQVDDFIDKLLISDKFHKVTEDIINKTVNKIRAMDHEAVYRNSNEKRNKDDKSNNVEASKENEPILIGNIDTTDLFKQLSSEKLLLNYKQFKEPKKEKLLESDKEETTHSKVKLDTNELETLEDISVKVESGSKEKSSIEDDNDHYDEKKKINLNSEATSFEDNKQAKHVSSKKDKKFKVKTSKKSTNESTVLKKPKHKAKKTKTTQPELKVETTEKSAHSDDEDKKLIESESKSSETASDIIKQRNEMSEIEVIKPTEDFKHRSKGTTLDEAKLDNEESSKITEPVTAKTKKYREENGKNFTLNSSPEYQEYHEKLAKVKETTFNFANM